MPTIHTVQSAADILRCHPVMHELRPHIDRDTFLTQVRRQMENEHYQLAYVEHDAQVVAVAGFRPMQTLAWGKIIYVDDLVTASTVRSKGHGEQLLNWLIDLARSQNCDQLHLDSGVQRHAAHRFYFRRRLDITAHHFAIDLRRARIP